MLWFSVMILNCAAGFKFFFFPPLSFQWLFQVWLLVSWHGVQETGPESVLSEMHAYVLLMVSCNLCFFKNPFSSKKALGIAMQL